MANRDMNDIVGGTAIILLGLFVSIYAFTHYDLGTVVEMETGMVPTGLGVILVVLGIIITVPAFFRDGKLPNLDWKQFFAVLASLSVFALAIERLGLVPAIFALVFIARLGDKEFRPVSTALLALALCAIVLGIFVYGLGMPLKIITWNL